MGKGSSSGKRSGKGKKLLGNRHGSVLLADIKKKVGGETQRSSFSAADLEALINRF